MICTTEDAQDSQDYPDYQDQEDFQLLLKSHGRSIAIIPIQSRTSHNRRPQSLSSRSPQHSRAVLGGIWTSAVHVVSDIYFDPLVHTTPPLTTSPLLFPFRWSCNKQEKAHNHTLLLLHQYRTSPPTHPQGVFIGRRPVLRSALKCCVLRHPHADQVRASKQKTSRPLSPGKRKPGLSGFEVLTVPCWTLA